MMYQVLIVVYGRSDNVHTTVVEFGSQHAAEEAIEAITLQASGPISQDVHIEALRLYKVKPNTN